MLYVVNLKVNRNRERAKKESWRGLTRVDVAFPFGHGLSYAAFEYEWSRPPPRRVRLPRVSGSDDAVVLALHCTVRNVGSRAGVEVAQLYLSYPSAAGEPPLVLRGHRKTRPLEPGEEAEVVFGRTAEGLSTWQPAGWRGARGGFVALVGASSRNASLSHAFEVEVS